MPRSKAIKHGLNKLDWHMQAALEDPSRLADPYKELVDKLPLTSLTRVLFLDLLRLNPMTVTLTEVDRQIAVLDPALIEQCVASIPERHELIEWMRTAKWVDEEFYEELARLEDWTPELCADGCSHQGVGSIAAQASAMYDTVVSRVGSIDAAHVVAAATALANPVDQAARPGDMVLAKLLRCLGMPESNNSQQGLF